MKRYDDDYTGDLERIIYGRRVTLPARRTLGQLFDAQAGGAIRAAISWLCFRPVPEFEGSRVAGWLRIAALAPLVFALVWIALMVAGAVPWYS